MAGARPRPFAFPVARIPSAPERPERAKPRTGGGEAHPGRRGRDVRATVLRIQHVKQHKRNRPLTLLRALGSARLSFSFSVPPNRGGWRVEKTPRLPGSAGLVIQLCPDHSGLPHPSPDATAPLGAPCAASSAISLLRVSDRGRPYVSAPTRLVVPRNARGRDCESRPQEPHPVPLHERLRESAPRWTGRFDTVMSL